MTTKRRPQLGPVIQRVKLDKLTIFEITEAELEALERGSPESIFLNLAISVISVAISFSITLLTTPVPNLRVFIIFVILMSVGYLFGIMFAALWWQSRQSVISVSKTIRSRIIPAGVQEKEEGGTTT